MSCASDDAFSLLLDDGQPADRVRELEAHLSGCASCRGRLESMRSLHDALRVPARGPSTAEAFRSRVSTKIAASSPTSRERWRWPLRFAIGGAGAMCALMLVYALVHQGAPRDAALHMGALSREDPPGTFIARGGALDPDARVGVEAFQVREGRSSPLRDGALLYPEEGFAFRATNLGDEELHVVIFALDERGEVHWLHPQWRDPKDNPASLRIAPRSRGVVLEGTVRPVDAPGKNVRVVAVMSATPTRVRAVEAGLAGLTAKTPTAARFPGQRVMEWRASFIAAAPGTPR